jgi:hypothetical protein
MSLLVFFRWLGQHDEKVLRWVQVMAIIIGGTWALFHFSQTERPTLERHAGTSAVLSWHPLPTQDACEAALRVEIKNNGRKSFDVSKIILRVWTIPVTRETPDTWKLLSFAIPGDVKPIVFEKGTEQPQASTLITHYPPGLSTDATFRFAFKRQPYTRAVLQVEFVAEYRPLGLWKAAFPMTAAGDYDFVCGAQ